MHSERVISTDEKASNFGSERLVIAVLTTMIIASVCGFLVGYRLSRWRLVQDGQPHSSSSSTGSYPSLHVIFTNRRIHFFYLGSYDSYGRARLTRHDSLAGAKLEHVYGAGPGKDAVSLVSAIPQNGTLFLNRGSNVNSGFATPKLSAEKNFITCLNNSTLPRDYKVKKVYL